MGKILIPFVDLKIQYRLLKKSIDRAIADVIASSQFIGGTQVESFEQEFGKYLGITHCISVNSGTDALILGLRALGLRPGDEVIIPVNTFIATALGATENNLKPVFVDIDPDDDYISLNDLKNKITGKTKAIIVVHLYGQPEKLNEIHKIILDSGNSIYLIEDASQAHGAEYSGNKVGTFGIFSAFSFYPGKNLGAYGDGGAIVTNNDSLAQKYRLLREYGQKVKYFHDSRGINSRLDAIQAAILRVKLAKLDYWNEQRRTIASEYNKKLYHLADYVKTPTEYPDRKSVYHLYVIKAIKRDKLLHFLKTRGIQTLIHYPKPLHLQCAFSYLKYQKGDFPYAEKFSDQIVSLPIYPGLTSSQIDYVTSTIHQFYTV